LLRKLYLCGSITTEIMEEIPNDCCDLLRKLYFCGSITTLLKIDTSQSVL